MEHYGLSSHEPFQLRKFGVFVEVIVISDIMQVMLLSGVMEINAVTLNRSKIFCLAWWKKFLRSSGSPCMYGNFSDGYVRQVV
jgi:hypothetical protein